MDFGLTLTDVNGQLHAVATGDAGLPEFLGMADLLIAVVRGRGQRVVLIDLLQVRPHLSFTEHLQIGSHMGLLAQHVDRVASLVPEAQRTGSSEKAARKTGVRLRTFSDREEALHWLNHG